MTINIGINGFGRIGKTVLRTLALSNHKELKLKAVNVGGGDISEQMHMLQYDSVHGRFDRIKNFSEENKTFSIHGIGDNTQMISERDPAKINWKEHDVDIVLECTGVSKNRVFADFHIKNGAKKVIVSSPIEDPDKTIVFGVNQEEITNTDNVISAASCTTNCLAPILNLMHKNFSVKNGFMTTVHSYTNDQNLVDSKHKDPRRARAATMSIIPTTTGAAKTIGQVIKDLNGKLDGISVRVPTPNVSMLDLVLNLEKTCSLKEVNKIMKSASEEQNSIIGYCDEPLVSIDFNQNPSSAIYDSGQTMIIDNGKVVKIVAWYDNEWAFSTRMLDIALFLGKKFIKNSF